MLIVRALLRCMLLVLLLGSLPGRAATELSDDQFNQLTQRWNQTLDSISADLSDLTVVGESLAALRENIRIIEEAAAEARDEAVAAADEQQALLDAIGPPPADDEPPEDEALAAERSLIADRLSSSLGRVKRCSVVLARARDLRGHAVEEETAALLGAIEERTVSPLMPGVAMVALAKLRDRFGELGDMISRSWQSGDIVSLRSHAGAALAAVVALALLVGLPLRQWLLRAFGPDQGIDRPSLTRRFEAALSLTVANALLPALVIFGLGSALAASLSGAGDPGLIVDVLLRVALDVVPLVGLAYAVVMPDRPSWRISALTNDAAGHVFRAICAYALVLLVMAPGLVAISPMYAHGRFFELAGLQAELSALGGLVAVILFGLAMLNLVRRRNWRSRPEDATEEAGEQELGGALAHTGTVLVAAGVIASMVLCAVGYVNLGAFVVSSMTRTLILLGYAFGLRVLFYQGLRVATSAENPLGRSLRRRLVLDDGGAAHLVFWVMLAVDVLGALLLIGTIAIMWGLPGAVLDEASDLAINGVEIGGLTLSLVNIGFAIGVFVLLLTAVRVFQRFLADRVLVQTRLELGVRDALATGVSYVGYVLAALITFAVLGLDLSNIALIFGALSVGIGFGLQHVVSNFVSGLILLVQRPIKTGDWIVVGDQQGYVRRISVISTEIQTFDAAAVIVPNSTMLSSQVVNWHLHNKLGRVIIRVGVAYDSNPDQVREVLLACAEQNTDLLKRPAPQVFFLEFGESSLNFELRFFLREIDESLRVSSDLRFAIKKAFAEAGIEIPYPQRDLHIRGVGPLAKLMPAEDAASATPAEPRAEPVVASRRQARS
jgi:potassium-dependent mechanosensitive channel